MSSRKGVRSYSLVPTLAETATKDVGISPPIKKRNSKLVASVQESDDMPPTKKSSAETFSLINNSAIVGVVSAGSTTVSDPASLVAPAVAAKKISDNTFTLLGQVDVSSINPSNPDDETDYDSFLTQKGASSRYNYSLKVTPGRGWGVNFESLLAFGAQYGHYDVPITVQGLGVWLNNQRSLKRKSQLPPDREAKLQALVDEGKLHWDQRDMLGWDEHFANLLSYGERHGHCNVPYAQKGLGLWLSQQRCKKRRNSLQPDRAAKLQQLVDEGKLKWNKTDSTGAFGGDDDASPALDNQGECSTSSA